MEKPTISIVEDDRKVVELIKPAVEKTVPEYLDPLPRFYLRPPGCWMKKRKSCPIIETIPGKPYPDNPAQHKPAA